MIVEMTILRLLGSRDDKEKIGVARPGNLFGLKDSKIEETVKKPSQNNQDRDILVSSVEPTLRKLHTSVH